MSFAKAIPAVRYGSALRSPRFPTASAVVAAVAVANVAAAAAASIAAVAVICSSRAGHQILQLG